MHQLTNVIIRAGIVDEGQLAEFKRWGLVSDEDLAKKLPSPTSASQVVEQLDQALQAEDLVLIRETDLDALKSYLANSQTGWLVLHDPEMGTKSEPIKVTYAVTKTGEYMMPWMSESIEELITNGSTALETAVDNEGGSGKKVYFTAVRELFFGSQKSFIVCTPHQEEANGSQSADDAAAK